MPGVCRIRFHTYATNGASEDHIGLAGVDCGSSGSVGMLHHSYLLPFFEENWIPSIGSHWKQTGLDLKANLVGAIRACSSVGMIDLYSASVAEDTLVCTGNAVGLSVFVPVVDFLKLELPEIEIVVGSLVDCECFKNTAGSPISLFSSCVSS